MFDVHQVTKLRKVDNTVLVVVGRRGRGRERLHRLPRRRAVLRQRGTERLERHGAPVRRAAERSSVRAHLV